MKLLSHRSMSTVLVVCCALSATQSLRAEPIKSIFIDQVSTTPAPLTYDGAGSLTVDIDSFTVLITREIGGVDVSETIAGASFTLSATGLSDSSSAPLASGVFSAVVFDLIAQDGELLLRGQQLSSADLLYSEALVPDVMFINSGPINIVGGSLAGEFLPQAQVFGIGLQIDPSTAGFDALDTDHNGSVILNLFPVPEPSSMLLLAAGFGCLRRFRGSRRRRTACAARSALLRGVSR